MSETIIKLGS